MWRLIVEVRCYWRRPRVCPPGPAVGPAVGPRVGPPGNNSAGARPETSPSSSPGPSLCRRRVDYPRRASGNIVKR